MEEPVVVKAALIGLGSVGTTFLSIIQQKEKLISERYGLVFRFHLLADSSGVSYLEHDHYDLSEVLDLKKNGGKVSSLSGYQANITVADALRSLPFTINMLFEASPVNIKGPLVVDFQGLVALSKENRTRFMYSATVCGGLPIINSGRNMIGAEIISVRGIFNSTSNFILSEMEKGRSYADALKEAQDRGIAETDPTLDVEGWDSANKLLILSNAVLESNSSLSEIQVEGITSITLDMIQNARSQSKIYKLIANAIRRVDGTYELTVQPVLLDRDSFLAKTEGWEMSVEIESDIYGTYYHKILEREPIPTSASMLRDAVNILTNQIGL